mmetsp:Transcript_35471/g.88281  ORF Transcript_35471/g.88281 Transcript_35471/m.88281 type:complete len:351 (-) Transcript_35471:3975-5027(-)
MSSETPTGGSGSFIGAFSLPLRLLDLGDTTSSGAGAEPVEDEADILGSVAGAADENKLRGSVRSAARATSVAAIAAAPTSKPMPPLKVPSPSRTAAAASAVTSSRGTSWAAACSPGGDGGGVGSPRVFLGAGKGSWSGWTHVLNASGAGALGKMAPISRRAEVLGEMPVPSTSSMNETERPGIEGFLGPRLGGSALDGASALSVDGCCTIHERSRRVIPRDARFPACCIFLMAWVECSGFTSDLAVGRTRPGCSLWSSSLPSKRRNVTCELCAMRVRARSVRMQICRTPRCKLRGSAQMTKHTGEEYEVELEVKSSSRTTTAQRGATSLEINGSRSHSMSKSPVCSVVAS